ncbi:MAG TPA: PTS mannitol transporter subunit IICB [Candidatus Anaerostipes excrementavium]|uniref:PTS system mannitol-specific EIICB component n=1 Tax=Candidatus Anaerostipes excrementavium TaxID=2838463 RepID=A0A9D1WVD0_9FIRM|nr:PTS mannitol transporter subunit IICB [uncultured Anaerostipes sp.]HIX67958.1 PTS mannitol transporter subunit IICB [Candidatus Anaerostipes excrementavium]
MANEIKAKVQKMGGFLSGMVMPNIGALIAWGIVTALFLETGYFPNEKLAELITPTLTYLIPILFGYTGGYNVYGRRGAVAGTVATIGVVVGADVTMMIGGMIMGPLGAWIIKQVDKVLDGHVKPGMEMLVDNFSMGIVGAIMMIAGYAIVTPIFAGITNILTVGVNFMISHNILPFTEVFVVPGQVLFLNNAINHGIFTPLAIEQASETGKSILYLVEANGGMWAGLVLAFAVFGKGMAKKSAPGAAIIQIIGGIGEVSFPYALIKPVTILGPILGGIAALFWFQIMDGGAVAAVSPGSLIALIIMSPKGKVLVNVGGYAIATVVSFVVVAFFLKRDKTPDEEEQEVQGIDMSQFVESHSAPGEEKEQTAPSAANVEKRKIKKIAFACDAGMGSSAMGASMLKTQLNKAGLYLDVSHVSIHQIPEDIDVVVTNTNLLEAAKKEAPAGIPIIEIKEFLNADEHKAIVQQIKDMME